MQQTPLSSTEYIPVHGQWERKDHPNWPERAFEVPEVTTPGQVYYVRKGFFVAMGTTARLEKLPSGGIAKTPLENPLNPMQERINRESMACELAVYRLLGDVPFAPKLLGWDAVSCTLTLEDQANGSLEAYIGSGHDADTKTRTKWAAQAAKALAGLHVREVIHADVAPRNFLLNQDLDLLICDFAGSSFSGRPVPPSAPGSRYQAKPWGRDYVPTEADDIFGLGSVLYFIMTGNEVYSDLADDEVERRLQLQDFPAIPSPHGWIVDACWTGYFTTAEAVANAY